MVVMEMGQHQQVQSAAAGPFQVIGRRLTRVLQVASSAVQHQGAVTGQQADTFALSHIQRCHHCVSLEITQS